MENVFSYLKWRGDLNLSVSPFNAVDSLILAMIAYVDFDGIVPGIESEETITLNEASEEIQRSYKETDHTGIMSFFAKPLSLLKEAAKTERFGGIRVGKYVNRIDRLKEEQFSASTFKLNDNNIYLAYKGTDTTLVGWKEDLNMAYIPEVPAQSEAVGYLEKIFRGKYRSIRIGGHSKGGNLAVYSALKCNRQIRDRILSVDNFDGPGFTCELISDTHTNLLSRITNYVPQASIIGLLLNPVGQRKIVKSLQVGISQHDPFTWEVNALDFSFLQKMEKSSLMMDSIIKEWINKLDVEQRECFVNALFAVLTNIGIEKISDFSKVSNDRIKSFVKSIGSLPAESRAVLAKALQLFLAESRKAVKKQFKDNFRLFVRK